MKFHPFTAAQKLHFLIEPAQCWLRRSRWMTADGKALAVAALDPGPDCQHDECRRLRATWAWYTGRFKQARTGGGIEWFKPTATILDLDAFPRFADFAKAVAKSGKGNINRDVKKAEREGYRSRRIAHGAFNASIEAIRASKYFRSGGPVLNAFFDASAGLSDEDIPAAPPRCNEHWIVEWAVFPPPHRGSKPVGHLALQRVGNMVRVMVFMGHGEHLAHGVMKLLSFDVIAWLLDRSDPAVQGLQYLFYGAAEHGNRGLFDWKRRMQFRPYILDTRVPPSPSG